MRRRGLILCLVIVMLLSSVTFGHSGRTDSSGGHKDNKNKSGLGSYHYHHGIGPHLHSNGICPYAPVKESSITSTKSSTSYSSYIKYDKEVETYQKKLNSLSFDCGEVDGYLGQRTKNAIMLFQKSENLYVDGKLNEITKKSIDDGYLNFNNNSQLSNVLQKLSKNQLIQMRLKELGYYNGQIDGSIGPLSLKAIKQFQDENGLEVDGIVGPITSKYLGLD